jgi:hypothetical protein
MGIWVHTFGQFLHTHQFCPFTFFFKTAEGQKKENNKRMDGQWVFSLLPPFFPNSKTYSFSLPSLGVGQIHIHSFHWPNHSTAIATSLAAGPLGVEDLFNSTKGAGVNHFLWRAKLAGLNIE